MHFKGCTPVHYAACIAIALAELHFQNGDLHKDILLPIFAPQSTICKMFTSFPKIFHILCMSTSEIITTVKNLGLKHGVYSKFISNIFII